MAQLNKRPLTVDIDVKLHVDIDVAYQALNIIDIWLDENPLRKIEVEQLEDGTWCNNLIPGSDEWGVLEEETTPKAAAPSDSVNIDKIGESIESILKRERGSRKETFTL